MKIEENIIIRDYTTLKLGGKVKYLYKLKDFNEINQVLDFSNKKNIKALPIGGGSNIFAQNIINDILILKIENKGIEFLDSNSEYVYLRVYAGEVWDDFVSFSVSKGFSMVESLSLIPGTVGATPIQNVGAYGSEVSQTIESVRIFDFKKREFVELKNSDCNFSYRDSVFKKMNDFVIESVVFKLRKNSEPFFPDYPNIKEFYEKYKNKNLTTLENIRNTVIKIRQEKLPNPNLIPNSGSFFKNIILGGKDFDIFNKKYPEIPYFKNGDKYKIPSAVLIDKSGLKGFNYKNVGVYKNNALVLINNFGSDSDELLELIDIIKNKVKNNYGLDLSIEPFILL